VTVYACLAGICLCCINRTGSVPVNATLRHGRGTIVAVEKQ